eukprot:7932367-Alexandrium_andersonii.AAC.1
MARVGGPSPAPVTHRSRAARGSRWMTYVVACRSMRWRSALRSDWAMLRSCRCCLSRATPIRQ